jgi:shikimate 5-dehydrogenase
MPYKKDILPYLDEVHGVAKVLGVVNTVVKFCGKLHGYNTDWYGMYTPLIQAFNQRRDLKGKYGKFLHSFDFSFDYWRWWNS